MIDLGKLEKLARDCEKGVEWWEARDLTRWKIDSDEDAALIAAVTPEVVLELIERAHDADRLTHALRLAQARVAAAWDEGYDAGHRDARAVQPTYPDPTPNPYRRADIERQDP